MVLANVVLWFLTLVSPVILKKLKNKWRFEEVYWWLEERKEFYKAGMKLRLEQVLEKKLERILNEKKQNIHSRIEAAKVKQSDCHKESKIRNIEKSLKR